jgi:hypothetical protein
MWHYPMCCHYSMCCPAFTCFFPQSQVVFIAIFSCFILKCILEARVSIIHIFPKRTYIQAHTTYTPCSTLILVESSASIVGPLTMYCTQIECD